VASHAYLYVVRWINFVLGESTRRVLTKSQRLRCFSLTRLINSCSAQWLVIRWKVVFQRLLRRDWCMSFFIGISLGRFLKRAFLMALSVYLRTKYVCKSTDLWKLCHSPTDWLRWQSIWLFGNRVAQVCARMNRSIGLYVKTVKQKVNDHIVP